MTEHYKAFLTDLVKVFGFILNAFLFFSIITYTFISVKNLFISFILLMSIGFILFRIFRIQINRYVFFLILLPLLFNCFFLFNYVFSKRPGQETYRYAYGITDIQGSKGRYSSQKGRSTTIYLEGGVYKEYTLPRMFFNYEKMKDKSVITYDIEDGFFGFRVVKDYEFSEDSTNHIFQY